MKKAELDQTPKLRMMIFQLSVTTPQKCSVWRILMFLKAMVRMTTVITNEGL